MVLTEHDSEKPLEQGEDNCSVYMDKVKNAFGFTRMVLDMI